MTTPLALLAVIFMLRSVVCSPEEEGRTIQLPKRTPGMTDEEYHKLLSDALGIPGAVYSFTGSDGRSLSGRTGDPTPFSPRGKERVPPSRSTGYGGYPKQGTSGKPPPSRYGMPGQNNMFGSGGRKDTDYNPQTNPSRPVTLAESGGRGNSYNAKPYQPITAEEDINECNPVSSSSANQFGLGEGGVQDAIGGQQQESSPRTAPVFDPKGGTEAAEKVAIAIVDGIRNVWNTQRKLTGGEKPLMDICEQAVANQQPAMKEMKRSDKTLLDVLPIWREKLTVELENFYQNEVRAKDVTRGSQQLHFMLLLYAECVRPKLVLMKV